MSTFKTTYALDLTNEGISLWHRGKNKSWTLLGNVALTAPNFSDDIEKLKDKQTPDINGKYTAQVRIPQSEIFASITDISGASGKVATAKIKYFLEESTPYKADELAYDFEDDPSSKNTYVAAVTKQTIAEAREFITGYGFKAAFYTTKLDKKQFPRNPRFYDGDTAQHDKAAEIQVTEPAKKPIAAALPTPKRANPATPAKPEPIAQAVKADLSGFSTVRTKTPTALLTQNTSNTPPRRISIDLPKLKPAEVEPLTPPVTSPINTPQGEAVETAAVRFIKPKFLLYIAVAVLLALLYLFYTTMFSGKEEIARLQQKPLSEPLTVAELQTLGQLPSQDTAPFIESETVLDAPNALTTIQVPQPNAKPETFNVVEGPPEPITSEQEPQTVIALAPTATLPTAQQPAEINPEITLTTQDPTPEGIPGDQGITLYSGQPDKIPPARDQLKISPDPLNDILPIMRSQAFETIHKTNLETDTTALALAAADAVITIEAVETPDLLALADPSLNTKRPKTRPASIARIAKQAQNSLVALADPSLAGKKPRRRPSNLKVPQAQTANSDEINLAIQQAVIASERPRIRPKSLSAKVARTKAAASSSDTSIKTASLTTTKLPRSSKSGNASPALIQKQATEKARFNKKKISLVGVYGTPTSRRALVRMPSGRFVKIKPGQKFSGWKVAAIGESSVRITKGSRNQVLRMPK